MRFCMVDRVTQLLPGESIEAIKCWTQTEDFAVDHFPTFPIVPGVLILESLNQSMGLLLEESYSKVYPEDKVGIYSFFNYVQRAKFKKFVLPGDRMIIKGKLQELSHNYGSTQATAFVEDEMVAEAHLSFALVPRNLIETENIRLQRQSYTHYLLNSTKINEHLRT